MTQTREEIAPNDAIAWQRGLPSSNPSRVREQPALSVAHVVAPCRAYPGETVTLFVALAAHQPVEALTLRLTHPAALQVEAICAPPELLGQMPEEQLDGSNPSLLWNLGALGAGATREYRIVARVLPTREELALTSRATLSGRNRWGDLQRAGEAATLQVRPKGDYLRYLPAIYEQDDFMGRFLMLFESFRAPIDAQIAQIWHYFDPSLTPDAFLPWLASWVDLTLDERWPLERRRALLANAMSLFRQRGTRRGLARYLELYTGGQVEIVEHRAENFTLGAASRLGPRLALGASNVPHTFTITVRLPGDDLGLSDEEAHRLLARMIDAEKPAHAAYHLIVERHAPEPQP